MKKFEITSGPHVGVIRNWIQWNFLNGNSVIWGSHEPLRTDKSFTPYELECLAQNIRDAVMADIITTQQLGELASKMVRQNSQPITLKFDHHLATCTLGEKKSPEYLGLKPALDWLFKHLKTRFGEE